jgi:uncharacterized protein YndB with AHSA1/START domain
LPESRQVHERVVKAPLRDVWNAWTTPEGIRSFLAEDARIQLMRGGAYEVIFDPDAPKGSRGTEGCRLLSYLPGQMLSFEWIAPADYSDLRDRRMRILLKVEPAAGGGVRVRLIQSGWGEGEDWDALYGYYETMWPRALDRLAKALSPPE